MREIRFKVHLMPSYLHTLHFCANFVVIMGLSRISNQVIENIYHFVQEILDVNTCFTFVYFGTVLFGK